MEALLTFRAAYAARESRTLAQDVPSVRAAPAGFATGASLAVVVALGIPLAAMGPAVLVAAGVASAAGGFAMGSALRALSPTLLLGKDARARIEREVRIRAERDLRIRTAQPPTSREGLRRAAGRLVGTPAPSPFGDEPVLAARIVGAVQGRQIDDAWIAPGELRLETEPSAATERCPRVSIAWIDAEPRAPLAVGALSAEARARLDAYLFDRALEVTDGAELSILLVRHGDQLIVTGRASVRNVSDGYRGSVEVLDVLDAIVGSVEEPLR